MSIPTQRTMREIQRVSGVMAMVRGKGPLLTASQPGKGKEEPVVKYQIEIVKQML
jgi:hypothetical protein